MVSSIPSFVRITPFGPYCGECNTTLRIEKGILEHAKECHPTESSFKNAVVVRAIKEHMKILRERHCTDYSLFLKTDSVPESLWFCTSCFTAYARKSNFQRHIDSLNGMCTSTSGGNIDLYQTICGRKGPKSVVFMNATVPASVITAGSTVSSLTFSNLSKTMPQVIMSSKVPASLMKTKDQAIAILSPFVRDDEDPYELCLIYVTLLGPSFEGTMREYLSYSKRQSSEPPTLTKWIEAGSLWLNEYAAAHIANVSANVRSRLAEFEQKEMEGVVVGTRTFTLRRGVPRLIAELHAALRFFFHYPTTLFDDYKDLDSSEKDLMWMIQHAVVPRILFTAVCEEPTNHGDLPVACRYCLSRGFTMKAGDVLTMNECGWFSSRISAMMHLLRAGVCGHLVTLAVHDRDTSSYQLSAEEMEIVRGVQNGRVTNLLAPYVKRLRDMNSRKPPVKNHTVNGNGDITCGPFTFLKTIWSTIIPRLVGISKTLFGEIFLSSDWELFINHPVMILDWVGLDVYVKIGGRQVFMREMQISVDSDENQSVFARLQAIGELCLFGLGTGAVRFEELSRLKTTSCQWHNSYMYYWTESLKQGSMRAKSTPRLVEHRLSVSLSRVFLLIRKCLHDLPRTAPKSLFPSVHEASMLTLVQDIFDFDYQPQMLHVRHLFTSIGNIIMPERSTDGGDERLVSNKLMTEKSGHTQGTGRRAYSTVLENSEEALYDYYHQQLGEVSLEPPPIDFVPFPDFIVKSSLRELIGKKAAFRHSQQRRMVDISCNSILRHAFVGLPCGHGKSMSWMVPIVASFLTGRHVGLRLVVLPYKFLLGHLVDRARTQLGVLHTRLTVEFLESADIAEEYVPSILLSHELPALLFLNLDSAARLLRFHMDRLQTLANDNLLKRIYVDEFQQLIIEFGFRDSYHVLRQLGRVGVPVVCLSGSLPTTVAMNLMTFCGLHVAAVPNSVDVVDGLDPVGDGFTLNISQVENVEQAVVAYIMQERRIPCHIICSSRAKVRAISSLLLPYFRVLSVTGDSSSVDQIETAMQWSCGEWDVLVSTSVALVGNENPKCKTVVIAGFLYNISSLVQAFGRLRPEQRGDDAVVSIFRTKLCKKDLDTAKETEENLFLELKAAGCVGDETRTLYRRLFSPVGLLWFFFSKQGCYLQTISSYFDYDRPPCGKCTLCRRDADISEAVVTDLKRSPVSSSLISSPPGKRLKDTPQPIAPVRVSSSGQKLEITVTRPLVKDTSSSRSSKAMVPVPLLLLGKGVETMAVKRAVKAPLASRSASLIQKKLTEINVVRTNQVHAVARNEDEKKIRRLAGLVLNELQYRCVFCGFASCTGDICLGNACYRCGSRAHHSNMCEYNIDKLKFILADKGVCFGCFDSTIRGMRSHPIKECPLRRRLRRLVFDTFAVTKVDTFEDFLRGLYATELTFMTMISRYSDKVKMGK